jgi:excisionase family DNA binding protein
MTEALSPVKGAAQRLGISVWTLRRKVYQGEVASVKIGAKLLVPESEIVRLVREGTRPRRAAGSEPAKSAPAVISGDAV